MKRYASQQLVQWKGQKERKPMLMTGARNVGKTSIVKEFGQEHYEYTVYLNFEDRPEFVSYFSPYKTIEEIYSLLSFSQHRKLEAKTTLLILDEVHQCPDIFDFARRLSKENDSYHVVLVTSFFGSVFMKEPEKVLEDVEHIHIKPLVFSEFLEATNEVLFAEYVAIKKVEDITEKLHVRLLDAFHYYLIVGGMPQCVASFCAYRDPQKVLKMQRNLVMGIKKDIHLYHGRINEKRISLVFDSIVNQLSKEHEKFQYGLVKEGARAREFEIAIKWLEQASIIRRVFNVSKEQAPVTNFENQGHFKVYFLDAGLLKMMANVKSESILLSTPEEFLEQVVENCVLQHLDDLQPHYYADYVREVDFILQKENAIIEVEVDCLGRVGRRTREDLQAICLSEGLEKDDHLLYIPLYMVEKIATFL